MVTPSKNYGNGNIKGPSVEESGDDIDSSGFRVGFNNRPVSKAIEGEAGSASFQEDVAGYTGLKRKSDGYEEALDSVAEKQGGSGYILPQRQSEQYDVPEDIPQKQDDSGYTSPQGQSAVYEEVPDSITDQGGYITPQDQSQRYDNGPNSEEKMEGDRGGYTRPLNRSQEYDYILDSEAKLSNSYVEVP